MATTQTFQTFITLNAQQAKNEMDALQKKVDDLKKKKADALKTLPLQSKTSTGSTRRLKLPKPH